MTPFTGLWRGFIPEGNISFEHEVIACERSGRVTDIIDGAFWSLEEPLHLQKAIITGRMHVVVPT